MDKKKLKKIKKTPRYRASSFAKRRDSDLSDTDTQEGPKDLASRLLGANSKKRASEALRKASMMSTMSVVATGNKTEKSAFKELLAKDEKYAAYAKKDDVDAIKLIKPKNKYKLSDSKSLAKAEPKGELYGAYRIPRGQRHKGGQRDSTISRMQIPGIEGRGSVIDTGTRKLSARRGTYNEPALDGEVRPLRVEQRFSAGGEYTVDPTHRFRRPRPSIVRLSLPPDDDDDETSGNLDYEKNNVPLKTDSKLPLIVISHRIEEKLSDPSALKKIYSRKSKKHHKQSKLTKQRARAIFGNHSKLAEAKFEVILRMFRQASDEENSRSINSEPSNGPDLSWIQEYSDKDLLEDPDFVKMPSNHRQRGTSKMFAAFAPIWYPLILLGRMPFSGGVNKKTGFLEIELRRKSCRFVTFCLTSLLIFIVLVLSVTSTAFSYNEFAGGAAFDKMRDLYPNETEEKRNSSVHPYTQLEILHLEKHWLPYMLLMLFFIFATICNLVFIISGHHTAKLICDIVNTTVSFQIDGSKWIWASCVAGQIACVFGLLYKTFMCVWRFTDYENEVNGYLTMSTTRFFYKYIRTHLDVYPYVAVPIFMIQLYATYAAFMHILFPTVLAIAVNNIATHWNFRLGLLLGKIKVTSVNLRWIKRQLNYEFMFKCHIVIREMVFFYSMKAFSVILISWYCGMVAGLCCVLFRIARMAGIDFDHRTDKNKTNLPNTTVEIVNIRYVDPPGYAFIDSGIFLLSLTLALLIVTDVIGKVGRTVMERGFGFLRRHGLLGCKSPHERRLVLSLFQCFSARHPCIISPGNLFKIDRKFIVAIIEVVMVLFTTMIQARMNQLIQHEILGLCDTGLCVVGYVRVGGGRGGEQYKQNVQAVINANKGPYVHFDEVKIKTTPAPPTTLKTTTAVVPTTTPVVTTTTPVVPTTTPAPTIPTLPPVPEAIPAILDPILKLNLYHRCPHTDFVKQRIYTKETDPPSDPNGKPVFKPVELPRNVGNCVINYYRPKSVDEKFYDALGEPIDPDPKTYDSFGTPPLPKLKYMDLDKVTASTVDALKKDKDKYYTERITVTTEGGANKYDCQKEETLVGDKNLLTMVSTGKSDWSLKPTVCNVPSLFLDAYATAWKKSVDMGLNTIDVGTPVAARLSSLYTALTPLFEGGKRFSVCGDPIAYWNNMNKLRDGPEEDYATELGIKFRLAMDPKKPTETRIWIRQNYRALGTVTNQPIRKSDAEEISWDWGRLKKSRKSIFLPYPHGNNGYLYDCHAQKIGNSIDDCGLLPFRTARKDSYGAIKWQEPIYAKPVTYTYEDPDTKIVYTDTVKCWQHQYDDYLCGMRIDASVTAEEWNYYLYKLCRESKTYRSGNLPTEYLTED